MTSWARVLLTGLCLAFSTALADGHDESGQAVERSVMAAMNANSEFSIFVAALERVEMIEMLEQEGPFTILAPTNQAFEQAGFDVSSMELSELSALVHNHIVPGVVTPELLITLSEVETLLGRRLAVIPFEEEAMAASPSGGDIAGGGEGAEATDGEDPETPPAEEPPQTEATDPEEASGERTIDADRETGAEIAADEDPETPPAEPSMPEGGVGTEIGAATISYPLTETANGVVYGIDTVLGMDAGEGEVQESP